MSNHLEYLGSKGSTMFAPIQAKNNIGGIEDITWAVRAKITIREDEDTAPILVVDSSLGSVAIDYDTATFTILLSQLAADSLVPGVYLVIISLQDNTGKWRDTEPFFGEIGEGLAVH